jgi:asparagine synthase (glutamine-hydrolysing)
MSGICGAVRYDGAPVDPDCLKAIAEKAPYRMDGGVEYWIHGSIGLAYLASPPSSISSSGLCSGDRLVLAADARLDNRAELAHLLAATGRLPAGALTDLELIRVAFACWGPNCCERLQGAYSLACWNEADSSLLLLRDRLGERPLYWCSTPQALFFASEPAQLLAVDSIEPAPNLERILAYLLKQPFDPAWSLFRHIQRLPEAHFLLCKDHQTTLRHWSPRSVTQGAWSRAEAAEALTQSLEQAVARRLSTDGESGVLLSGGLDSSSVAAKASALLERQAKQLFAYTWESRSGDKLDERKWSAALVGARPNIVEYPVLADERYPLSRYPEAYADPNAPDTNTYPDLLLATIEIARQQGVQVLMNGIGGDLVIGGCPARAGLLAPRALGSAGTAPETFW